MTNLVGIIEKYTNHKDGLFLMDLPTGYGKTTAIVEYISNEVQKNSDRKIFYITNLIKNLPIEELRNSLGKKSYSESCLFLEPYANCVINNWDIVDISNESVKKLNEYKELRRDILAYNKVSILINEDNKYSEIDSERLDFLYKKISTKSEPAFRKSIKKILFYHKNKKEKLQALKENKWLIDIYPTINLDKYKVILLTTKKFILPVDPIIKKPFKFYDNDIIDKANIFIDEFDATKSVLLSQIIEDGLKKNIDIIKLFINIYQTLDNIILPHDFQSMKYSNENFDSENLDDNSTIFIKNRDLFKSIFEKYNFEYAMKTEGLNEQRLFIFDEFIRLTVIKDNQRKQAYMRTDDESQYNKVLVNYKKAEDCTKLINILSEIVYALNHFYIGLSFMANNYSSIMNSRTTQKDNYITIEESIWTVISLFNIPEEFSETIYNEVISVSVHDKKRNLQHDEFVKVLEVEDKGIKKNRFLRKGFEYITVIDSDYHALQSKTRLIKFFSTPEDIILKICNRALVIGVSATATINTVIGNYDINYIVNQLDERYYETDDKDQIVLYERYLDMLQIYKKVDIFCDIIDKPSLYRKRILSYIKTESPSTYKYFSGDEEYYSSKLMNILVLYTLVCITNDMNSFIYFGNSFPKETGGININILKICCDLVKEMIGYYNIKLVIVKSKDYDIRMEEISKYLSQGTKVFVITTYATLGTGKNIQYDIPPHLYNSSDIIMGDKDYLMKDFDGIMLAQPTYLTQNLRDNHIEPEKVLAQYLFEQQYLYYKNTKNRNRIANNIEAGFRRIFFNEYHRYEKIETDVEYHTAQKVIQALGRICRTKNKSKKIYVFTEKEIVRRLKNIKSDLSNRMNNKEFKKLMDIEIQEYILDSEKYDNINRKARLSISKEAMLLRASFDKVENWKRLREFVLKNPTANHINNPYKDFYFDFPIDVSRFIFKFGENFSIKDIKIKKSNLGGYKTVSDKDSNLVDFMKIDYVKNAFIKKGYATNFEKNKYVMSYSLYNQIYKGALGEVVGKLIIEKELRISLNEIAEIKNFEYFDFNYRDIVIDFKHWDSLEKENDEQVLKCIRKLKKVGAKRAIIINIVKRGNHQNKFSKSKEILRIPFLINIENNNTQICNDNIEIVKEFITC